VRITLAERTDFVPRVSPLARVTFFAFAPVDVFTRRDFVARSVFGRIVSSVEKGNPPFPSNRGAPGDTLARRP
jgi:hypothetical protein